jgi:hypothetical protein
LQEVLKISFPHLNIALILVSSDHFLGNGRDVQSGPLFSERLTEVVEIIVSSSDFNGSITVISRYEVCNETFCSIYQRGTDINCYTLSIVSEDTSFYAFEKPWFWDYIIDGIVLEI